MIFSKKKEFVNTEPIGYELIKQYEVKWYTKLIRFFKDLLKIR